MEDWPEDEDSPRKPPRATLRPVFVAVLIVVACLALAVWTLRNPYAPPPLPEPEPEATAPPTPAATRKAPTAVATRPPATWAVPTLPPATAAPTAAATATAAATRPPVVTAPPTATPAPAASTRPREPPSLRNVAPPRVKKGSTTLLDVRGKGLRADLRAIILRGSKVPPEIAVPRQRFVDDTLLQVLIVVAPGAPKGEYDVSVADVEGRRSNSVKFEIIQ